MVLISIVRILHIRTKTATTISQCWSLVANFPKICTLGVIASTIDVFDPIEDKLLLQANSTSEPEALILSLSVDTTRFTSDYLSANLGIDGIDWYNLRNNIPSPTGRYLTNFAGGNTYPTATFQRPMYSVSNGICYVDGFILVRSWGHLLTLPTDCRPSKRIGFSLNNNANQAR